MTEDYRSFRKMIFGEMKKNNGSYIILQYDIKHKIVYIHYLKQKKLLRQLNRYCC